MFKRKIDHCTSLVLRPFLVGGMRKGRGIREGNMTLKRIHRISLVVKLPNTYRLIAP